MSRILIVSALHQEISNRYEGGLENHAILYTGVGKVNATYNLTKILNTFSDEYDLVINSKSKNKKEYKLERKKKDEKTNSSNVSAD